MGKTNIKSTLRKIKPDTTEKRVSVPKRHVLLAALIAAISAFAVYANTIGHSYTVDDDTVMAKNSITKGGLDSLSTVFSTSYRAGFWDRAESLYRPLSVAMFTVEWHFFPENPMPGHLINVILFSLTVFLLMLLLAAFLNRLPLIVPFAATMIFAVHPIHTEVVANIKSRDEILCLLFCLISLWQYHRYLIDSKTWRIGLALAAFMLAMLSKENAITFLVVFPLWDYFTGRWDMKPSLIRSSGFVLVVGSYLLVRKSILGDIDNVDAIQLINNSLIGSKTNVDQFATAIAILGKYIYLLLIPHPLSFDYSFNQIPLSTLSSPEFWIAFFVLSGMAVYSLFQFKNRNPISFGFLFFMATVSVASNIFILIESTMAERFVYMPSVGFVLAGTLVLAKFTNSEKLEEVSAFGDHFKQNRPFLIIIAVIVSAYAVKTIDRNGDWKDNFTLLSKDVKTSPNSARIRYAFGSALLFEKALKTDDPIAKSRFIEQSVVQLERGVGILPDYAEAWKHLGIANKERENFPAAVAAFEKARSYKPFDAADIYATSGLCYGKIGKYDLAFADLRKALSMSPNDPESMNNMGLYMFESGAVDSSLIYFDQAIAMKKDFYQAYYNKGNTHAKKGDYNEAIRLYAIALQIKPNSIDAIMNTGNCYAALNNYRTALDYFKQVEAIDPNNRNVIINLGITYNMLGDQQNAAKYLNRGQAPAK
ncbi:MAG: tetratricopeptide repeat protein [Bacteroidota bacterium]